MSGCRCVPGETDGDVDNQRSSRRRVVADDGQARSLLQVQRGDSEKILHSGSWCADGWARLRHGGRFMDTGYASSNVLSLRYKW